METGTYIEIVLFALIEGRYFGVHLISHNIVNHYTRNSPLIQVYDAILQNQSQSNADRKEFSSAINLNTKNVALVKSAIKTMQLNLEARNNDNSNNNAKWMKFMEKVIDTQSDLADTIK